MYQMVKRVSYRLFYIHHLILVLHWLLFIRHDTLHNKISTVFLLKTKHQRTIEINSCWISFWTDVCKLYHSNDGGLWLIYVKGSLSTSAASLIKKLDLYSACIDFHCRDFMRIADLRRLMRFSTVKSIETQVWVFKFYKLIAVQLEISRA